MNVTTGLNNQWNVLSVVWCYPIIVCYQFNYKNTFFLNFDLSIFWRIITVNARLRGYTTHMITNLFYPFFKIHAINITLSRTWQCIAVLLCFPFFFFVCKVMPGKCCGSGHGGFMSVSIIVLDNLYVIIQCHMCVVDAIRIAML